MPAARELDMRADERMSCRIRATIKHKDQDARAALLDLSEDGTRVYIGADLSVAIGDELAIETMELGHLTGKITWLKLPYAGVRLSPSSNTSAKVFSYFRGR